MTNITIAVLPNVGDSPEVVTFFDSNLTELGVKNGVESSTSIASYRSINVQWKFVASYSSAEVRGKGEQIV